MSCLLGIYHALVRTAQLIVLDGLLFRVHNITCTFLVHETLSAFPKADKFGGVHHVAFVAVRS